MPHQPINTLKTQSSDFAISLPSSLPSSSIPSYAPSLARHFSLFPPTPSPITPYVSLGGRYI